MMNNVPVKYVNEKLSGVYWNFKIGQVFDIISIQELVEDKRHIFGDIRAIGETDKYFIWGFRAAQDIKNWKKERKKCAIDMYCESILRQNKDDLNHVVYWGHGAPDTKVFCNKLIYMSNFGFWFETRDIDTGEEHITKSAFELEQYRTILCDRSKFDVSLSVGVVDGGYLYVVGKDKKWKTCDVSRLAKKDKILFEILVFPPVDGKFEIYNSLDHPSTFFYKKMKAERISEAYTSKMRVRMAKIEELKRRKEELMKTRSFEKKCLTAMRIMELEEELGISSLRQDDSSHENVYVPKH